MDLQGFSPNAAALPPLADVIRRHGLAAKKALGQHFLLDARLMERIVALAGEMEGVHAIEIGPGPGGLTRALLASPARHVHAVEMDTRCLAALAELGEAFAGRLTVHHGDALAADLPALTPAPRKIVANLPYNISAILLARWLEDLHRDPGAYDSLVLMFQKEVAQRILATPGGKAYGRISVIAQWLCDIAPGFDIPPGAFSPPPKVMSSVIRLAPKKRRALNPPFAAVEAVTKAAFGQRRKMLRSSLKSLSPQSEAWMEEAGISPQKRAEQLEIIDFLKLAEIAHRSRTKASSES